MKTSTYIGALLLVLVLISVAWYFGKDSAQPSQEGFKLVSLEDNAVLVSDPDVLYYNWTSQEIAIADEASQRLLEGGDRLYNFTSGFVITIDGEEVYYGVFRMAIHSAIPPAPQISILFPSMLFTSETQNYGSMRMFYPFLSFQTTSQRRTQNSISILKTQAR